MCDSCGCGDPDVLSVPVQMKILSENDRQASHNREHFLRNSTFTVNLMGSPGSGKTALLEATAARTKSLRLAAISGDLATARDAERLHAAGIPSLGITTGSACHLDAKMLHHALHAAPWHGCDVLFVENVGNLVCPAVYDLGQTVSVVCLSVTEGVDKPLKYPVMFRAVDLVLITKVDLLPHLPGVRLDDIRHNLKVVMPDPVAIPVSAVSGVGLSEWLGWLEHQRPRTPG